MPMNDEKNTYGQSRTYAAMIIHPLHNSATPDKLQALILLYTVLWAPLSSVWPSVVDIHRCSSQGPLGAWSCRVRKPKMATVLRSSLSMTTLLLLLLMIAGRAESHTSKLNAATKEVLDILRDPLKYDNGVMAANETGPLEAELQLFFREIDIDDIHEQVTVDMTFRMIWKDSRLAFTTPGVPYVTITEPELAWFPDPFFKHAISTQQQMTMLPQNYLRVYRDGRLVFSTRLILLLSCDMDFSRFPHDVQLCSIPIASYGYTIEDLIFYLKDTSVTVASGKILSTNFFVDRIFTDSCNSKTSTGVYSCEKVDLRINRLVTSYILEWYLPCVFLVIVTGMSELVVASEFLTRVLMTLVPLITLAMYAGIYALLTTASVPYFRPLDIFSSISLLVIFLQLLRVVILHYYAQRKIKEERGELLPRHPRDDFLETIIVNADNIAKYTLIAFYLLFVLVYIIAYST
ncbi:Neurotransmitter-gated ion-channel ligand-binding domain [Trinorchestia longiramus]|nr:Neurotransmitter-gated ion-channel ligand-binding domain [Trinorchestia longiramus]